MKKRLLLLVAILCLVSSVPASASSGLQALFVDGLPVLLSGPVLSGGNYFVPVRLLAESFGLSVRWDERLRQVYLESPDKQIILSTTDTMRINGAEHVLERRPFLRQGQLFVPLRSFVEALGGQVDYVERTESVYLYMPDNLLRQVFVSSTELEAIVSRDDAAGVSIVMTSRAGQLLNAVVVASAGDGRIDLVSWVDSQTGLPLAIMRPDGKYDARLHFPAWVNGVDQVDVIWVDSTRFRGEKPHESDIIFSFAVSFRTKDQISVGQRSN